MVDDDRTATWAANRAAPPRGAIANDRRRRRAPPAAEAPARRQRARAGGGGATRRGVARPKSSAQTRWFLGRAAAVHPDGCVDINYDDGDFEPRAAAVRPWSLRQPSIAPPPPPPRHPAPRRVSVRIGADYQVAIPPMAQAAGGGPRPRHANGDAEGGDGGGRDGGGAWDGGAPHGGGVPRPTRGDSWRLQTAGSASLLARRSRAGQAIAEYGGHDCRCICCAVGFGAPAAVEPGLLHRWALRQLAIR